VVPEVNPHAIAQFPKRNIIANPNCSTIQMVVALKPLHDLAEIKRIVVSTYQSVSGAGKEGWTSCSSRRAACSSTTRQEEQFTKQIAFNVIPHIDVFPTTLHQGRVKMAVETRKILDPDILVTRPACACRCHRPRRGDQRRVRPAAVGRTGARGLEGLRGHHVDRPPRRRGYVTPVECAGDDPVFISRVREDKTVPHA